MFKTLEFKLSEEEKEFENIFISEVYNFMQNNVKNVLPQSFFSNDKKKWFADFDYDFNDENDFLNKIKNNFEHALYCFAYIMKYAMDKDYQKEFIDDKYSEENERLFKIKNWKFMIGVTFNEVCKPIYYIKYLKKIDNNIA